MLHYATAKGENLLVRGADDLVEVPQRVGEELDTGRRAVAKDDLEDEEWEEVGRGCFGESRSVESLVVDRVDRGEGLVVVVLEEEVVREAS